MKDKETVKSEENDSYLYDRDLFCDRVTEAKQRTGLDWDDIADAITAAGYPITKGNLKTYIFQRPVGLKLLLYLSRTLHVSIDYLIGNEENATMYKEGFDYKYTSHRYKQYKGEYYFYFFPTRTNEPEELVEAKLTIHTMGEGLDGGKITLVVPVDIGEPKVYTGHMELSETTNNGFMNLSCRNGEIIQFTFNDPNTFQEKAYLCIGALVSVSSGDAKRTPTLSRAAISYQPLKREGKEYLAAHLRLNSKYVFIERDDLRQELYDFFEDNDLPGYDKIYQRLTNAFAERSYFAIEEQYLLNTFKSENKLNDLQTEKLIARLRSSNMSAVNSKVPRVLDARLFLLLRKERLFEEEKG